MASAPHCVLALAAFLALPAACDAPPAPAVVGAAIVDPPPPVAAPIQLLPAPVAETIRQLREIAATGSYRDMARLAEATPDFRSNTAGMSHRDYWYLKLRTGDWPMAQVERLLALPHATAGTASRKVYVWPHLAMLRPDEITPAHARDIDSLLGEGHAEAIRNGAAWPGYVLGIAEDGTWLYFVSGAG